MEETETPLRKCIFAGLNLVRRLDQLHGRHNFAGDVPALPLTSPPRESAYSFEMIYSESHLVVDGSKLTEVDKQVCVTINGNGH